MKPWANTRPWPPPRSELTLEVLIPSSRYLRPKSWLPLRCRCLRSTDSLLKGLLPSWSWFPSQGTLALEILISFSRRAGPTHPHSLFQVPGVKPILISLLGMLDRLCSRRLSYGTLWIYICKTLHARIHPKKKFDFALNLWPWRRRPSLPQLWLLCFIVTFYCCTSSLLCFEVVVISILF